MSCSVEKGGLSVLASVPVHDHREPFLIQKSSHTRAKTCVERFLSEGRSTKSLCFSSHSCAHVFRLSYQDMRDWLASWPALALACAEPVGKDGQIRISSKSQRWKRCHAAGAPPHESLFVLTVLHALRSRLIGVRDLRACFVKGR